MQPFVRTQIKRAINESNDVLGKPQKLNTILENMIRAVKSVRLVEAGMPSKEYQKDMNEMIKHFKKTDFAGSGDVKVMFVGDEPNTKKRGAANLLFRSEGDSKKASKALDGAVKKIASMHNFSMPIGIRPYKDNSFDGKSIKAMPDTNLHLAVVEYKGSIDEDIQLAEAGMDGIEKAIKLMDKDAKYQAIINELKQNSMKYFDSFYKKSDDFVKQGEAIEKKLNAKLAKREKELGIIKLKNGFPSLKDN